MKKFYQAVKNNRRSDSPLFHFNIDFSNHWRYTPWESNYTDTLGELMAEIGTV